MQDSTCTCVRLLVYSQVSFGLPMFFPLMVSSPGFPAPPARTLVIVFFGRPVVGGTSGFSSEDYGRLVLARWYAH